MTKERGQQGVEGHKDGKLLKGGWREMKL